MRRVLFLARQFPPIGGAGVHRTLGSVGHLQEHGFQPLVVTGVAEHRDRWEPRDEELLARVPADVEVHRLQRGGPPGSGSRLGRLRGAAPPWVHAWVDDSAELALRVGRDADVVYASCLPYETAFAGARVAAALGRPWIADLEDPWALDEMRPQPSRLHEAMALREMRRALATAAAVVMAAPEAAERVKAAMPELAGRVHAIPIGFEPADFTAAAAERPEGTFRIVHTGSMHTEMGEQLRASARRRRLLGGTAPGLDIVTRSHVFVAQAIERATLADPELEGRIELHLAGELTAADRAACEGRPFIRTPGLLGHRETVALMRSADLLFLPMHDLPAGRRAGLIPYKTFEYLAAGRPILAAVPDGDVRDMLEPLPQATVVRPADVAAMAEAIARRVAAGREPDSAPPAEYERGRCVARIAEVIEGVVAQDAGAPRRSATPSR
jgi:glycosyltransferase involved in cell wall biosynthesis